MNPVIFSKREGIGRRRPRWFGMAIWLALMALATAPGNALAGEPPAPELTAISPNHGPKGGGNAVVITGANFTGATAVWFGHREAESFTVDSDNEITAVAPPSTGPGEEQAVVYVNVVGPGGESGERSLAAKYGYSPVIDEIQPRRGPATGGTAVTLFGYGLEETSAVDFGSVPAQSFTVNPDGSVTAISPPITPGETIVPISATTPEGITENFWLQEAEPANFFTYGPTVTGVSPNEGSAAGGTTVIIHGTGFMSDLYRCLCPEFFVWSVSFGSSELKCGLPLGAAAIPCSPIQFEVKSETEIVATTPPGSGTVNVGVFTEGGPSPANSAAQFTYASEPTPPGPTKEPQTLQLLNCSASGRLRHQGVDKVCSSRSIDVPTAVGGSTTARLYRGKVTYAKGSARVRRSRTRLWLTPLRTVKPGRYALSLSRPGAGTQRETIVIR